MSNDIGRREELFRASKDFQSSEWFDWCLYNKSACDNRNSETRPGRIIGFFSLDSDVSNTVNMVIQPSSMDLSMTHLVKEFAVKMLLDSHDCNYIVIPVSRIVHPLLVMKNYGGSNNEYFSILPKRKWNDHFNHFIELDLTD